MERTESREKTRSYSRNGQDFAFRHFEALHVRFLFHVVRKSPSLAGRESLNPASACPFEKPSTSQSWPGYLTSYGLVRVRVEADKSSNPLIVFLNKSWSMMKEDTRCSRMPTPSLYTFGTGPQRAFRPKSSQPAAPVPHLISGSIPDYYGFVQHKTNHEKSSRPATSGTSGPISVSLVKTPENHTTQARPSKDFEASSRI